MVSETEGDEENRPIMELKEKGYDEIALSEDYVKTLNNIGNTDTPLQSFEVEVNYNENE